MSRKRNSYADLRRLRAKLKIKPLHETLQKEVINAMRITKGDKVMAAALLGIGKTTIYRKLEGTQRSR